MLVLNSFWNLAKNFTYETFFVRNLSPRKGTFIYLFYETSRNYQGSFRGSNTSHKKFYVWFLVQNHLEALKTTCCCNKVVPLVQKKFQKIWGPQKSLACKFSFIKLFIRPKFSIPGKIHREKFFIRITLNENHNPEKWCRKHKTEAFFVERKKKNYTTIVFSSKNGVENIELKPYS